MGTYANYVCDLHGHTNRSDGQDTPRAFIEHAALRKVKIAAITDHDIVPPSSVTVNGTQVDITAYALEKGIKLIKGIEISCETNIEDVHLLCYGCDWDNEYFQELAAFTIRSKIESYKELVQKLEAYGMPLSWEEMLYNGGQPVPEERIQKKMIFQQMAEKGYVKDWSEAKLLVKNHESLQVDREKPEAREVIYEVHRQGGIVIQAHPYLVSEQVMYNNRMTGRNELTEALIYAGLDGLEGRYTYDKTSYQGSLYKEEIYREIVKRYKDRISIISGGSDYHGDGKKGVQNPREIGECGITESEFYQNSLLRRLIPAR